MGRRDWYYVHLPKLLIKRLDQFLQTPRAKSMGMANKSELLRHVINEFLDEQEAFYNKMESMEDFVLEIKDHDHIVLTFNNESQFKEIITAFVKRGIDYNEINVLIIYRKEEQKFLQSLDKFPNINYLFNLQDIMIIPADESFHNDNFSVEPVVKRLRSIEQLAKERSKKGLNILATLPAKLIEQGRYEDAVKIENVFNIAIGEFEQPITLLCLYKSVPENLEDRFSEYHDLIIKRSAAIASTDLQ
ncbi:MAG TPA: MEDS domain-containing protein [Nitrososphaeraceae archaeon]|jgi:metal-responsive CopG/Arc/MetJ family transcriptional regulator|nr:MEDS domain-containing protein [Nitrososphaeraceae archaeon]